MFSTDQLTCDQVRQQQVVLLPLSALPTVAANLDVPVSYDQVYEIPGNLAGGIGPASQKFLQKWMDRYVAWVKKHAA